MRCGSWDFGSGLGPRRSRSSPNCFSAVYVVFYFVYVLAITLEFQFFDENAIVTMFFQGSLQDGIALAVREAKAVVCFVRGRWSPRTQ